MLDIGWQELLVIGALALIVVGPKDLPSLLRTLGQYAGKIRGMAREFQRTMDDAARESDLSQLKELREIGNDMRSVTQFNFEEQAKRAADSLANPPKPVDPIGEFKKVRREPDPVPDETPIEAPAGEAPIEAPAVETPVEPPMEQPADEAAVSAAAEPEPARAEPPKA